MDIGVIAAVIAGGGVLGVVVWVLAKLGKALITIAEALAAAAAVIFAVWLVIKTVGWALRQVFTHWRTSLTVVAVLAWWHWWGGASLALTAGVLTGVLAGWRLVEQVSFDAGAGRYVRAWWLRWTVYAPKLPEWLHACGLSIRTEAVPVMVVSPLGRALHRGRSQTRARLLRVLGVRSGASWDEVRVRLVPGQKPEDFDEAARAQEQVYPSTEVTLPWGESGGKPVTVRLLLTGEGGRLYTGDCFHKVVWQGAFRTAGVGYRKRADGMHALRHFYASTLLAQGVSIKSWPSTWATPTRFHAADVHPENRASASRLLI